VGQYKRKLKKGERWFYSGQYLGITYFSKAIYLTKQAAKMAERTRISELDEQARNPDAREMFLLELINARLDQLQLKRSHTYYRMSKAYFQKLLNGIGDILVTTIKKESVNTLFELEARRLTAAGKTHHKLNEFIRVTKALFNYGIKVYDLNMKNPCVGLDLYPIDIKTKYIPTEEEIAAVYVKLNPKQKILFDFVKESGARINEAVRFFNNPEISHDQIVLYTRKSKNSNLTPRHIPKPECLSQDYSGLHGEWKDPNPRFIEGVVRELELPTSWNFHNLRHRIASIWANSGMSTIEIMQRLGHSNIGTTMKYLQLLGFTNRL
jgi:integrase